jgi:hypothetical protein
MQGAAVEAASTTPAIVSQSTCEAKYCMASLCVMSGSYIKKVLDEIWVIIQTVHSPFQLEQIHNQLWTRQNHRGKRVVQGISRRFRYVRHCVGDGTVKLFKVQGTNNPANCLTKALPAKALENETIIFQNKVDS